MSFADSLSGLKLYLICWFSYCKDWISPSPITVWLKVDLSAVSLFCLTEVIPLRQSSFCFPAFLAEVMWVTSYASMVVYILRSSWWFYKAASVNDPQMYCGLNLLQGSVKSTHWSISFWCLRIQSSCLLDLCWPEKKSLCKNRSKVEMPVIIEDYKENSIGHYLGEERFQGHFTKRTNAVYCLHVLNVS